MAPAVLGLYIINKPDPPDEQPKPPKRRIQPPDPSIPDLPISPRYLCSEVNMEIHNESEDTIAP